MVTESPGEIRERIESACLAFGRLKEEMARAVVGHEAMVEEIFIALVCGGHCLLEGVPGLGKTLVVRSLGAVLDLSFSRIQFTPDLMPADITGTNILANDPAGKRVFDFQHGPIFANIVLADEINRATPKTQSALLEGMQEQSVTVGGRTHHLQRPFIVLATQNPIEMEGTYPLPEAQVDRFFFKLLVSFPGHEELRRIADLTSLSEPVALRKVLDAEQILKIGLWVRDVPVAETVKDYAVRLVLATHPENEAAGPLARRFVQYGSSPRGLLSLILGGKARACLSGRPNVSFRDIQNGLMPSLRHRLILNLQADAEGVTAEKVLEETMTLVPEIP